MKAELKIIETRASGDIHITENSQYNNLDAENVTVAGGVQVRLFGNIRKVLIIEKHSVVYLHGVAGEIDNRGGDLFAY